MKLKIFNRGKGWYSIANNYKDQNDKQYVNIHFAKCDEPSYEDNGRGFSVQDIDILEGKLSCYQSKVGMVIFKYDLLTNISLEKENDHYTEKFGGDRAESYQTLELEPNDLPFY